MNDSFLCTGTGSELPLNSGTLFHSASHYHSIFTYEIQVPLQEETMFIHLCIPQSIGGAQVYNLLNLT